MEKKQPLVGDTDAAGFTNYPTDDSDGWMTYRDAASGLYLTAMESSCGARVGMIPLQLTTPWQEVLMSKPSPVHKRPHVAQQWKHDASSGRLVSRVNNAYTLDLDSHASYAAILWTHHGGANQRFTIAFINGSTTRCRIEATALSVHLALTARHEVYGASLSKPGVEWDCTAEADVARPKPMFSRDELPSGDDLLAMIAAATAAQDKKTAYTSSTTAPVPANNTSNGNGNGNGGGMIITADEMTFAAPIGPVSPVPKKSPSHAAAAAAAHGTTTAAKKPSTIVFT